jgi:hypothetical protein
MSESKIKNKVGRPKFVIDYVLVEDLASIMCTIEEIASILGCSRDTLQVDKEFSYIYKKGLDSAKASLRRKQYKLADTNPAMAIFLGKNYLNQSDRQEITTTEKPIIVDNIPNDKTN